jgi:carbon storage regulator CsrA
MDKQSGLVLKRKNGEGFYIGDAFIKVIEVGRNSVRLVIIAPDDIKILREELLKKVE